MVLNVVRLAPLGSKATILRVEIQVPARACEALRDLGWWPCPQEAHFLVREPTLASRRFLSPYSGRFSPPEFVLAFLELGSLARPWHMAMVSGKLSLIASFILYCSPQYS